MDERSVQKRKVPFEKPFNHKILDQYKGSRRYFEVKGFAWFACPDCDKKPWPSAHAWCFIDLKMQKICFRYKQYCKNCENRVRPKFTQEALQKMAAHVVKWYLIKIGKIKRMYKPSTETDWTEGGRHDEKRCEKCI